MQLHRVMKLFLERRRSRTANGSSKWHTHSQLEQSESAVFFTNADDTDGQLLLDQVDVGMPPNYCNYNQMKV